MNRYTKILLALFGTIVLGAIGSGLWERLLSHWFDVFVTVSVVVMSAFIKTYKDSIYINASNGFHEYSAVFVHVFTLMFLPAVYYFTLLRHPLTKKNGQISEFIRSKKGYYILVFITLSLFVSLALSSFKLMYTNRIVTHAFKSIDILSPYLTDNESKTLLAQFRSVSSEKEYDTFLKQIENYAEKNKVTLPKIKW